MEWCISLLPTCNVKANKLLFAMRGAVAVEGGYGILYSGFTETLELPE